MSNTPGISPLTPDIEKVRHSDEDEDEALIGEEGELFDDPDAMDEDEDDDEKEVDPDEERDDVRNLRDKPAAPSLGGGLLQRN